MEIENLALDRYEKAALHNEVEEGNRIWLPDEFEDDIPDLHLQLDESERQALYAGVIAHDHYNRDRPVLSRLSGLARLELLTGSGKERGLTLRVNEFTAYQQLQAAAWTVRNATHIVPEALLELIGADLPDADRRTERFQEAIGRLARIVTQLETAGVLPPAEESQGGS